MASSPPPRLFSPGTNLLALLLALLAAGPLRAADPPTAGSPPVSDEVMRPTEHGLRVTPTLAVLYSRAVLDNIPLGRDLYLSDDQKWQLAGVFAKHGLDAAAADPKGWQALSEAMFEAEVSDRGRFTPETAPEFARRCLPLLPAMRDYCDKVERDARQFLDPFQAKRLEECFREYREELDRGEERLHRWSRGEIEKPERAFDNPRRKETPEQKEQRELERRRYQARHEVDREIQDTGPQSWKLFLERTVAFYGFDDEQKAKGSQILDEYIAKAAAIMTEDWHERLRRNRVRESCLDLLAGQPKEPLRFQLSREYRELIRPLNDLGMAFRDAIIALATRQQRETVVAQVRQAATEHGMSPDEMRFMESLLLGG